VTEGADELIAAVQALGAANVAVDDVALRRPTLDDVFLTLTGRTTADESTADESTDADETDDEAKR
jgi:ABC-2 type transport system ATP-binding protein